MYVYVYIYQQFIVCSFLNNNLRKFKVISKCKSNQFFVYSATISIHSPPPSLLEEFSLSGVVCAQIVKCTKSVLS